MNHFNQAYEMDRLKQAIETATGQSFSIDDSDPTQHVVISDQRRVCVGICDFEQYIKLKTPKEHNYEKTKFYAAQGNQLITLYQHEWMDNPTQSMNLVQSQFSVSTRVAGWKCKARVLDRSEYGILDENHLQNTGTGGFVVGLEYQGRVVSGMSFIPPHRQNMGNVMTLARFACIDGVNVQGGVSKLIAFAIDQNPEWLTKYDELVTWSHNRLSNGNVYRKVDFNRNGRHFHFIEDEYGSAHSSNKFTHDYYNMETGAVTAKQSLQKKVLLRMGEGIFEVYEHPTKTITINGKKQPKKIYLLDGKEVDEGQMAARLNWYPIYDSGKTRFAMQLKETEK